MGTYDYMANYGINFRNKVQWLLWESELMGQISDGQWENASPMEHYQPWAHAKIQVSPKQVGRNFFAQKDNYNFTNSEFLSVVGKRMLFRVKFFLLHPDMMEKIGAYYSPEDANAIREYQSYLDKYSGSNAYWQERLDKLEAAGITQEVLDEVENWNGFTMKQLRAELNDMKVIIRTRL